MKTPCQLIYIYIYTDFVVIYFTISNIVGFINFTLSNLFFMIIIFITKNCAEKYNKFIDFTLVPIYYFNFYVCMKRLFLVK